MNRLVRLIYGFKRRPAYRLEHPVRQKARKPLELGFGLPKASVCEHDAILLVLRAERGKKIITSAGEKSNKNAGCAQVNRAARSAFFSRIAGFRMPGSVSLYDIFLRFFSITRGRTE